MPMVDTKGLRTIKSRRWAKPVAEVLEGRLLLAVISVNTTSDADGADGSNTLSLRQAIEVSNGSLPVGSLTTAQMSLVSGALASLNTIDFAIPGTGPFTIMPATALPAITTAVTIDGYSQPGAFANTNGPGQADNAHLLIELNGLQIKTSATGLDVEASGSTVKGLAIGGFGANSLSNGIDLGGSGGEVVEGDYIGTDTTGTLALPNAYGIDFLNHLNGADVSNSSTVGGTTPGARNVISGNTYEGLEPSSDNLVEGNFIGTDATGVKALPNSGGIFIGVGSSNTIGGTTAAAGNVISGNFGDGLDLGSNSLVEGNFIGTDLTGTLALPNAVGISVYGSDGATDGSNDTTIGGTTVGARNIISGNTGVGVFLSSHNLVEGNFIGTDVSGNHAIPNASGIQIGGSSSFDTVGGTAAGAGNVISGNVGDGIDITGTSELVEGNLIGTDLTGSLALPNADGINLYGSYGSIDGGNDTTIGGTTVGARNVISGNMNDGIGFHPGTSFPVVVSMRNLVEGNFIGTDSTGTKALPNGQGLDIPVGGFNTIGGTAAGAGNVISGNMGDGIDISGTSILAPLPLPGNYLAPGSTNNLVEGKLIGLDATGTKALPNRKGIFLNVSDSNTIGGTAAGAGNVISGNNQDGLDILGSSTQNAGNFSFGGTNNLVEGNLIGLDATGTSAVPNSTGIALMFGDANTIGGTTASARNVISGNVFDGINLTDIFTPNIDSGVLIEGNDIGTDGTGSRAIPNGTGINLQDANSTTIGGTAAGSGNIISGNIGNGVTMNGYFFDNGIVFSTTDNLFEGNFIGLDATGAIALPNQGSGISITDGLTNTIGGTTAGAANIIGFNGRSGVVVEAITQVFGFNMRYANLISGNSIYANIGRGIDLGNNGVTPNNPSGSPLGPNQLQPYPVLISATLTATGSQISATLDALPAISYTVEFFSNPIADPSGFGQGQTYLGSTVVTTDARSHASFRFTTNASLAGQFLSATATDPKGNTSEFARDFKAYSTTTQLALGQPIPTVVGQPLTLLATVSPAIGAGTPTGQVEFTEDGQPIGSSPLDANGIASLTIAAPAGSHVFAASFAGSPGNPGSSSAGLVVNVAPAPPPVKSPSTTTLVGPSGLATTDQALTFTANVATSSGVAPTGQVAFFEDGNVIGVAPVNSLGVATFTTTYPFLPGLHSVMATYLGDTNSLSSQSSSVIVSVLSAIDFGGPTVISALIVTSNSVQVSFGRPLLLNTAQARENYAIVGPNGQAIKIVSVVYHATNHSVTITTRQKLNPRLSYVLKVNGVRVGRVDDVNRIPLAGNHGRPGTSYVGKITPKGPHVASVHATRMKLKASAPKKGR